MKITWTPNPLNTIIELDEHEKELFKLKLKISELSEALGSASIYLDPKNADWVMNKSYRHPNGHTIETLIEEVRKDYLDMEYFYDGDEKESSGLDKRVDELFEHYIEELQLGHAGDCTCFPMSCSKCHAESKLGLDTIKGLRKHEAHKVLGAFSNGRDGEKWLPEKSLDEAIEYLRRYDPKQTDPESAKTWKNVGGFEAHVPRWKAEAASALEWLEKYKAEHFSGHQGDDGDTEVPVAQNHTPVSETLSVG